MKPILRVITLGVVASAIAIGNLAEIAAAEFPKRPITILVYTKPGGAADRDARKLSIIAERLMKAKFVVRNKTGAGGMVAMKYVLEQPADGYILMAMTKSPVFKTVTTGQDIDLRDFDWTSMTMSDPEALISNKKNKLHNWNDILADAKRLNAEGKQQIWVGPATGGLDHIFSLKVGIAAGIKFKYIPFKGGKQAVIQLLGGRGVIYVGNPQDILAQPDLMVAALSRKTRLKDFPDTPTFGELGLKGLDNEVNWRGYGTKKGIPKEAVDFYDDLFVKLNKDDEWKQYVAKKSVDPVNITHGDFLKIVLNDVKEVKYWIKKAGIQGKKK
jgi:tripartite-type tricarboxylate transporter receptor subunit TctC